MPAADTNQPNLAAEFVEHPISSTTLGWIWLVGAWWWVFGGLKKDDGRLILTLVGPDGLVTWVLQRDLEVMLGWGTPGGVSPWCGEEWVSPEDRAWAGLGKDFDGSLQDLWLRERALIEQWGWPLPKFTEVVRDVYWGPDQEMTELWQLFDEQEPCEAHTIFDRWVLVDSQRRKGR